MNSLPASETAAASLPGLEVRLDEELPRALAVGRGNAIFLRGTAVTSGESIRRLAIELDGVAHPAMAHSMPDRSSGDGFWAIVGLGLAPREVSVRASAELDSGRRAEAALGTIVLEAGDPNPAETPAPSDGRGPLVAIAMATFEPQPELFARQVESLRAQTHSSWVCTISDDHSSPEGFATIERAVADDARFVVSRADRRLGFYRNFERALAMTPSAAPYIALADQDDLWHADKLQALLDAIGDRTLAYSDARATRPDGSVISPSLWERRRNNHTNLASLLLSNTVTGAASLFRRELLDYVLPLPAAPGTPYHDHWIALVALATGQLAYVDRPLLDYVQHPDAVLGSAAIAAAGNPGVAQRLRRLARDPAAAPDRWRSGYFDEYCRTLLMARVLEMRCADTLTASKRRALRRLASGERSPGAIVWLAARPLRRLTGHNETMGFEHRLLRGIAWRWLAGPLARMAQILSNRP